MALAADARTSQPAATTTPTLLSNGIPPVSPAPSHTDDLADRIRTAHLLHERHELVRFHFRRAPLPAADDPFSLEIQTGLWATLY